VLRAAHQLLDSRPLVLDDPIVSRLIEPDSLRRIVDEAAALQTPMLRGLRAHVVLRSRFAEDRLAAAVVRGVTQYVILGAGFDTFSFRQPEWARSLRIIEVDQEGSQALKRERLAAAGVAMPANVTFASVDFERESLRDALGRHGVSIAEPTFFSWLGVTMYLNEAAVDAVLETVVDYPPNSEIVFTFAQPRSSAENSAPNSGQEPTPAEAAAAAGEPWLTYFEPEALERKLRTIGFASVEFLTPAEAQRLYFEGRSDGLTAPKRTSVVSAACSR
jgi:methyltransferase (TIGR00027 family)